MSDEADKEGMTLPEKIEQKWDRKAYVGLRHPTLLPNEERFISPARDIAMLTVPLIRGALQSAAEMNPDKTAGLGMFAMALGKAHNRILTDKGAKVCAIVEDLRTALQAMPADAVAAGAAELMLGFITIYGLGCRESTNTQVLNDDAIEKAVLQAGLLSRLPEELRDRVEDHLALKRQYVAELDRPAPKGEIREVPDEPGKTS